MPPDREPPLVIVGIDAGDPDLIQGWSRDGYLPAIEGIMRRGCWGTTTGPEMISEHGLWVSLLSGVSRARHEYYYFRQLKQGSHDIRTVTGTDIRVPTFWSDFADGDRKVIIVDVPDGYLMPGIPGVQILNWAVHNPSANPCTLPGALLREIRRVAGRGTRIDEDLPSSVENDRRIYRQLLERVERKGALCRHLLGRNRFDLAVMVFAEAHTGGHQFWRYRPQAHQSRRAKAGADMAHAIRDIYTAIDQQLAAMLQLLPADANMVLVTSVGLRDLYPMHGLIESFCRQLGYQATPRSGGHPRRPMDFIRALVPEKWRLAVSRSFPRSIRERIVADQFQHGTDWSRTTAFALPSTYTSHLRVNLRGRDPDGTVEPGDEYLSVLNRLESDLRLLVDPQTGKCPVRCVARTVDWFGGGIPSSLPDMFVEWHPCARFVERLLHPRAKLTQEKPEFFRGSDHSLQGFVAAAGPGIGGSGSVGDIPLLDLAPTFLALMGAPTPERMQGAVLEKMTNGNAGSSR